MFTSTKFTYWTFSKTGVPEASTFENRCEEARVKVLASPRGLLVDDKGRIIHLRDDSVFLGRNHDVDRDAISLEQSDVLMQRKIIDESKAIEFDPYFPGFSFWEDRQPQTKLDEYGHFWGIHQSGLIIFGCGDKPFRFNENLWQQFHCLLTFGKSGEVRRLYNSQNVISNRILREFSFGTKKNSDAIRFLLARLEQEFIDKNPIFSSRYEFLSLIDHLPKVKKTIIDLTDNPYYFGSKRGIELLTSVNLKNIWEDS